jgi:hypothetical protein
MIAEIARGIRPDSWEFPLFLHVLGAMVLVGALVLAATALVGAYRGGGTRMLQLGCRALLYGAFPGFLTMRLAAEWIRDKEQISGDNEPSWIGIGYATSDLGLLLLVVATALAGIGLRRAIRTDSGTATVGVSVALGMVTVMLIAYVVAIWAMTTKPL